MAWPALALLAVIVALPVQAQSTKLGHAEFTELHRYVLSVSDAGDPEVAATCLACHGPFEALSESTRDYVAPSGVPVNPHVTFDMTMPANPHASGEGVIACSECHRFDSHPIPIVDALPDADIDMCIACHHTGTFRACSDCH